MKAMKHICATVLIAAALSAGCSKDSTPTTTAPSRTSPVTETFISNLTVQGSVWRFVTAQQAGTLTATLSATDQPSTVVGFGIGLRNGTGSGCLVTREVVGTAGAAPVLSAQVDAGTYCVKVFETNRLTAPMSFTVTITYP